MIFTIFQNFGFFFIRTHKTQSDIKPSSRLVKQTENMFDTSVKSKRSRPHLCRPHYRCLEKPRVMYKTTVSHKFGCFLTKIINSDLRKCISVQNQQNRTSENGCRCKLNRFGPQKMGFDAKSTE